MTTTSPQADLIAVLRAIRPQPIEARTPLTTLRPLLAGTLTFEEAFAPEIQAAIEACEALAYHGRTPGRNVCERLNSVQPVPAAEIVAGW